MSTRATQFTIVPALGLLRRELVRFLRQRSRIVGVIASPIVFWLFLGSGFGTSFRGGARGGSYLEFFYPGTIVLTVMFTCIFSSISVIEDRKEGFLQSALVAPVSRAGLALGKVLGSATFAAIQGVILLALLPVAGIPWSAAGIVGSVIVVFVMSLGMAGLGFTFAWIMDSTQGFHAIMNLVLVPMWLLSGSVFPLEGTPTWLHAVMQANPLTYCTMAVRESLYCNGSLAAGVMTLSLLISVIFAVAAFGAAYWVVARK